MAGLARQVRFGRQSDRAAPELSEDQEMAASVDFEMLAVRNRNERTVTEVLRRQHCLAYGPDRHFSICPTTSACRLISVLSPAK